MAENSDADYRVVCQKIDTLKLQVGELSEDLKGYTTTNEGRLRLLEIQTRLLEQSNKQICKDMEGQDTQIEKVDAKVNNVTLLSKIFGGMTGFLAVVAAVIAILGAKGS